MLNEAKENMAGHAELVRERDALYGLLIEQEVRHQLELQRQEEHMLKVMNLHMLINIARIYSSEIKCHLRAEILCLSTPCRAHTLVNDILCLIGYHDFAFFRCQMFEKYRTQFEEQRQVVLFTPV